MDKKFRVHLVALPHTQVSPKFAGCAYTAKIYKWCKMMQHICEIYLYAPAGPPVEGAKLIPCTTVNQRLVTFGPDDPTRLPAWPTDEQSALFNSNAAALIKVYAEPHDLVLLSGGWTHRFIKDALPEMLCVEPGVGYEGILTNFCAFESAAWRHTVYAKKNINDGRWFDTVIPNYFDPAEFPKLNKGNGKYLLFLGRLIERKGPHIASEIARASGLPLYVAGAGGKQVGTTIEGSGVVVKDAKYLGPVGVEDRAELLAGARALLVPTTYIEPFGGVAVEAMFAGTPAITTDWGAFPETVQHGVSGFRFSTLKEGVQAVENVDQLDPEMIRLYARNNYSMDAVAPQFERWFNNLNTLWKSGWPEM